MLFFTSGVIIGDFNVNMLTNNDCQELASEYGFWPVVHTSTTIKGSLLDQAFINFNLSDENLKVEVLPSYFSDHHLICLCIRK